MATGRACKLRTPMPRFKLLIEYRRHALLRWQIQKNARTIQGEIDRAIRAVAPKPRSSSTAPAGTDAGVHALGQVAHLELHTALPPATLAARLNDELPSTSTSSPPKRSCTASTRATTPLPQLPLSDRAAAHGVREAVRLVESRRISTPRHARGGACACRHGGLQVVHRRRPGREVDARRESAI